MSEPISGGAGQATPKLCRCRRGHVVEKATLTRGERSVIYCQECYLDMVERECGGLEEVPEGTPPDDVHYHHPKHCGSRTACDRRAFEDPLDYKSRVPRITANSLEVTCPECCRRMAVRGWGMDELRAMSEKYRTGKDGASS